MITTASLKRTLDSPFEEALTRVPEALKAEGFGVLTEIDVQATMKQKLGADMRRYKILGACNPPFAHEALTVDLAAGLMMPCNVAVYETDDHKTVVMAVDPTQSAAATGNDKLAGLAVAVRDRLANALARL